MTNLSKCWHVSHDKSTHQYWRLTCTYVRESIHFKIQTPLFVICVTKFSTPTIVINSKSPLVTVEQYVNTQNFKSTQVCGLRWWVLIMCCSKLLLKTQLSGYGEICFSSLHRICGPSFVSRWPVIFSPSSLLRACNTCCVVKSTLTPLLDTSTCRATLQNMEEYITWTN